MIDSILLFSRAMPQHHPGGMETMTWNLATEWAKTVGEVRVVTTAVAGARQPFTSDGVTIVPLVDTPPGRYSAAWWAAAREYWLSLPAAPSVVLSVSAGAYSVVRARSRHPGTPFVLQAHGTSMMEIASKLRARDLRSLAGVSKNALGLLRDLGRYGDFDRVVAVGEPVVRSMTARPYRWAIPPERVLLVPNGIPTQDYAFDATARQQTRAAYGIGADVPVVACVGRLHKQKRLDRVLRAAAVLREAGGGDGFRFLLVGAGPDEARLRRLVAELDLREMVVFTGPVPPQGVRNYLCAADVAVLPTARVEGLPTTVLEALASGLDCVVQSGAVGAAALRTVLHEVETDDPALLADALRSVTRVRAQRQSRLPAEFGLDRCAAAYLKVFTDLVSAAPVR